MKSIVASILLALSISTLAEEQADVVPEPKAEVKQSSAASRAWDGTKETWSNFMESVDKFFEEKEKEEQEKEPKVTTITVPAGATADLVVSLKEAAVPVDVDPSEMIRRVNEDIVTELLKERQNTRLQPWKKRSEWMIKQGVVSIGSNNVGPDGDVTLIESVPGEKEAIDEWIIRLRAAQIKAGIPSIPYKAFGTGDHPKQPVKD